ncbi:MAG: hypothetical protein KDA41_00120, partial [Planctomycetales bacterium]|nr:hypothetical protein [Planctomycetales bacterium]
MKPFSISCTTCGARLKVRDERAIGELSLCPKCGSMVMVAPPSAQDAAAGDAAHPRGAPIQYSAQQLVVGGAAVSDFDDAAALFADTIDEFATQRPAPADAPPVAPRTQTQAPPAAPEPPEPAAQQPAANEAPLPLSPPTSTPAPPPIAPATESMSSIELDPRADARAASPLANAASAQAERSAASAPVAAVSTAHAQKPPPSTAEAPPAPMDSGAWTSPTQRLLRRYGLMGAAVLAAVLMV